MASIQFSFGNHSAIVYHFQINTLSHHQINTLISSTHLKKFTALENQNTYSEKARCIRYNATIL